MSRDEVDTRIRLYQRLYRTCPVFLVTCILEALSILDYHILEDSGYSTRSVTGIRFRFYNPAGLGTQQLRAYVPMRLLK